MSLTICVLAASGCGAGDDAAEHDAGRPTFDAGSAPDRNTVEASEICVRLAEIQCAAEVFCCADPGRTRKQCQSSMQEGCEMAYLDQIAQNAITGFDAARAKSALQSFEDMASSCDTGIVAWASSDDGFRGILRGTLAAGKSCAPNLASATNPVIADAYLAACKDPETHACEPRNKTKNNKLDWTCDAKSQADGPCLTDANCMDGLYCDNPAMKPEAKCVARKADADACEASLECQSLYCAKKKCVPPTRSSAYCLKAP